MNDVDKNGQYILKVLDNLYIADNKVKEEFPVLYTDNYMKARIFDYKDALELVEKINFKPIWEKVSYE